MALACPVPEHPVGDGAFCRICGRSYITVPDLVRETPLPEAPVLETPVLEFPPVPAPPPLPEPTFKHQAPPDSPFAELHVGSDPLPPPADPVLDTGLIQTRFAEMTAPEAPLGDLALLHVEAPEAEAEAPPAKTPRAVPPTVAYALAGAGGGALVMALLDRLVL